METLESIKIFGIVALVILAALFIFGGTVTFLDKYGYILIGLLLMAIGIGFICGGLYLLFAIGGVPGAIGIFLFLPGSGFIKWATMGMKS